MIALINSLAKLFTATWDLLRGLLTWLYDRITAWLPKLLEIPGWVVSAWAYLAASILAVITITTDVISMVLTMMARIVIDGGGLNSGSFSGSLGSASQVMAGINTFIPLDEAMAFLTVFMFVVVTCATIRMVKAWIPTLT